MLRRVGAVLAAIAILLVACGDDSGGGDSAAVDSTEPAESATTESSVATDATTSSVQISDTPVIDPGDGGNYDPQIDPADFVSGIDNPYLPFVSGATWSYEGTDGEETEIIDVVVLDETREVMGIEATVVHDTVSDAEGALIEDTYDWYAQDREGNVWYLGEESAEYEDGEIVSTEGSWEAGVDGALPGIVMEANPQVGDAYRQEYYEGEAEDMAEVARSGESETVAYGTFDDLLVIKEWNPLEPDVVEEKYYAQGTGVVLEVKVAGGEGRVELTAADVPL